MSTRANIVIKKSNTNGVEYVQLYHHWDGYPSYLGKELQTFCKNLYNTYMGEDGLKDLSPMKVAEKLNEMDKSYEIEEKLMLHGDIEFLYVIDLDKLEILCYALDTYIIYRHTDYSDIEIVEGKVPFNDRYYYLAYQTKFSDESIPKDAERL